MTSVRALPVLPSAPPRGAETSDRTKGLVRLTMACNERCPFCNVPVEDYPGPLRTTPAEVVDAQLDAFVAAGEKTLTISGGEPTLLRARLLALIADARARGIEYVELQTNAILVDADYAAALARAGLTSAFVSLLSHQPALHDALAGLEGAYEPCLRGIDALDAHGVRVTLNPVVAGSTQALVPDYVDFVAARLPFVESISLSAVQPHGRAAHHLDLLPDYAVLAPAVREARARAERHRIRLLNPYCGLPLCVGWEGALAPSVEAVEATEARGATFDGVPGIENRDDKRHGAPCLGCALRTRCGGAWHAYWSRRGGSGIAAPLARLEPWREGASSAEGQAIVRAPRLDETVIGALGAATAPTVWLVVEDLARGDAARVLSSRTTDLAIEIGVRALLRRRALLVELRALSAASSGRPPQARVRLAARLVADAGLAEAYRAARALYEAGVESIRMDVTARGEASRARWAKLRDVVALDLPGLAFELRAS